MTALVRKGTAPGRHVYDVIVIGGQLAGILTTALLAKRGLQVLHVPHDGLSAPYAHKGVKLPHAPFILPPIKAVPALDEVLHELGLSALVSRATQLVPLQLLEDERWYELSHDEKRRGPELARVFGSAAEEFDELLRKAQMAADASDSFFQHKPDFPPEGLVNQWKFKRQLKHFPGLELASPLPNDALVRKLMPFLTSLETPARLSVTRALGRALHGPAVYPGGREGLWQAVAERARELGADVLASDEAIERLVMESATIGIRLQKSDVVYRGAFLVAAVDLQVLTQLIPEKARQKAPHLEAASTALFTVNWVVSERALPRGLGVLALLDAPSVHGGALLIQVSPTEQTEQRTVSISLPVPTKIRTAGEPAIRELMKHIESSLTRVMPHTRQHVVLESTPWLDAPHMLGEPAPLFKLGETAWLNVAGLNTSSPWKRMVFANQQVLPGLGLEGEVLAAHRAVKMLETRIQKPTPSPLRGR